MVDFKEKVERYKALLIKWNKAINLFSRKLPIEELDLHIRDCEFLAESMAEEKDKAVLDFGTGNGMPGIVLSIYGFKCIFVERNKKKGVACKKLKIVYILTKSVLLKNQCTTPLKSSMPSCKHRIRRFASWG